MEWLILTTVILLYGGSFVVLIADFLKSPMREPHWAVHSQELYRRRYFKQPVNKVNWKKQGF